MKHNLILSTDSYKASQWLQYPPNTSRISSYIETRGGMDESVFFGLQPYLMDYLSKPVTREDIEEAESILIPHGMPFNKSGWELLLKKHGGYVPIEIEAVPEGHVMSTHNVQLQIVNTDPEFFWLTSYLETSLLRAIWYPSTVATVSRKAKQYISTALSITSDIAVGDQINFKLHDFGARGVSSSESAMIGGMAHLINFMGTDTVEALIGARKYYNENMAGFSIPASEHSTMTSWGQENESKAYKNMLEVFSGEGRMLACVSDSYDIYNATRNIWGSELAESVKNSGGTLVIRPDSGDPTFVPIKVIEILFEKFGYSTNSKGYKVLPEYIRVIQGDGINLNSIKQILINLEEKGISTENIAFGMGGGLLQQVNRDTLKYAMKASARQSSDGKWHDVYKDPIGSDKKSKKGRLGLVYNNTFGSDTYQTVPKSVAVKRGNILQPVFKNGEILKKWSFSEIRETCSVKTFHDINKRKM